MRTTVTIAEDVYEVARYYAAQHSISLGEALSRLVRQGLAAPRQAPASAGREFPAFEVPAGSEPISLSRTLAAEDDELDGGSAAKSARPPRARARRARPPARRRK